MLGFGQQQLVGNSDTDLDWSALNSGWVWGFFLSVSFSSDIFNSDQLSPLGSEES